MTRTCEGPAPAKVAGPAENATPRKHLANDASCPGAPATTRGDLLRQLGRAVMGCGHLLGAEDRLRTAAIRGAGLITSSRFDRTAVATVLSVSAQAAGIGQTDALAIIRETFLQAGVR